MGAGDLVPLVLLPDETVVTFADFATGFRAGSGDVVVMAATAFLTGGGVGAAAGLAAGVAAVDFLLAGTFVADFVVTVLRSEIL